MTAAIETPPSTAEAPAPDLADDPKAKQRAAKQAMTQMMTPIRGTVLAARVLAGLSAVLAIAPYIALVHLGGILLAAWDAGTPPDEHRVMTAVTVLISAFCTRLALYALALALTHFADARLGAHIRADLVGTLSRAPLSWFSATNSGRVRKAIQDDTHTIHMLVAHAPVEMTSAIVMPLALFGYAVVVDWRLGLLSIATFPIYAGLYARMMKGMSVKTAEMDTKLAKVSSTMVEFVSGISVVKAFGKVGRSHRAYSTAAKEFADFYLAWCEPLMKGSALATSAITVPVLLLVNLGGGAAMAAAGWVNPVDVLACSLIALVLPASIMTVGNGQWAYQVASASALRIQELLDTPILSAPVAEHAVTPRGHRVSFDRVSYSYGAVKAVDEVSLELPEGSVTALIGPSGSGKSTLATLVARFADPDSGTVRIGGVDLRSMSTAELYRNVAFVLQNPQLLRLPIHENIALARPGAGIEEVREAARAALIDDDIMALPGGYETVLDEDTSLSGGQAQRIAIARALLADAPILLLDEATAFVDPESEAQIQRALNRLVAGRTVLVIAHRPASIRGADRIVVMERGRVVAQGTHQELKDEPHYRGLWQMTAGAATEGPGVAPADGAQAQED